jgi:hypothetical protein
MIRCSVLRSLAIALVGLAASACAKPSLPEDLGTVDAAKAVVAAVQAKLGTSDVAFRRLDLERAKLSVYVIDPKDPKKILAFDVEKGELVGPSPVTRAGDTTSELIGVKVADLDMAGLAKAETECKAKLGQPTQKLSLDDGLDIVHRLQGPPGWMIRVQGDKFCKATLAGVITFP